MSVLAILLAIIGLVSLLLYFFLSFILLTLHLFWFSPTSFRLIRFFYYSRCISCEFVYVIGDNSLTTFVCYSSSSISLAFSDFFTTLWCYCHVNRSSYLKLVVTLKSSNVWCSFNLYFTYWVMLFTFLYLSLFQN